MTEHVNEAQRERLERLQARRSARSAPADPGAGSPDAGVRGRRTEARRPGGRRRHAARGSRVAAAGVGATALFGLVAVLGLDGLFANASDPFPAPLPTEPAPAQRPPPIQVIVHRVPATGTEITAPTASDAPSEATVPTASTPIELTATPVVRTVTVTAPAAAPATSRGSG